MNKWIAYAVVYNQEHFIRQWVQNVTRFADVALVMFSEKPWTYNPKARKKFKPDSTGKILAELERQYDNLKVIKGEWELDEDERNDALIAAREMGGRYLLIIDCDEFYTLHEMNNAKQFIEENPAEYWWVSHVEFIKQDNWAIVTKEGLPQFEFAVDLQKVSRFKRARIPDATIARTIPEELCKGYHYSYCMPYEKLDQKMRSWSHAHQVNKKWLKKVWPKIKPGITSFHPVNPDAWEGVVEVDTPQEIKDLFKDAKWLKDLSRK